MVRPVGPLNADVMPVDGVPAEQEIIEGEPFVGSAGSRLDSALESIGVDRNYLYTANLAKVQPREDRSLWRGEIDMQ